MNTKQDYYKQMASICAKQECCKYDILNKLIKKEVPKTTACSIISQLSSEGFINEERYCKAFVHDKFEYNHWGKLKIKVELMKKQILSNKIEEALDTIDEKEYLEATKTIIEQKIRNSRLSNTFENRNKLARFAYSKGFELDIIWKIIDDIFSE